MQTNLRATIAPLTALAALLLLHPQAASAQTDFTGKTIRLQIGSGPGGGYDTYGRLVARHMGRHIKGNPTIVPQNMPGASSLPLTNSLFNTAPRDGTVFAIINQSMPTEQFLHDSNINYDAAKFNWIGRATSAVEMAIVWHTVPINSIEDVRKREVIMGGTGPTSGLVFIPYLLNNLAGMKFKVITGFTEIGLAMERGEIEGSATPLESLTSFRADWVRDKKIKILAQYTAKRDPAIPNIPTMVELGRDDEARRILSFNASSAEIGRAFVAPPGMPADTVAILRRAFDATLADPAFLDELKRAGLPLNAMTGELLQAVVADIAKFPQELIQKARTARLKPN